MEQEQIHKETKKKRVSKIEEAGEVVMLHILKLVKNSNLSFSAIAKRVNELYQTDITYKNIIYFVESNINIVKEITDKKKMLGELRAKLYVEYNTSLVKDIKELDEQIEVVKADAMLESNIKAKTISNLIDNKGKLLIRYAKLSGNLMGEGQKSTNVEVNVFNKSDEEKSDIIQRLKRAKFEKGKKVEETVIAKRTRIVT